MEENATQPVLVATDLSARSDRAVERGFKLAEYFGTRLVVCHALQPGSPGADNPETAEKALRKSLPDPNADIDIALPTGSAPQAIANAAQDADARIIVAGVARWNSLGDYFLGNAIEHLVSNAEQPVLVVKSRAHAGYKRLLVATDFSNCSRLALKTATEMFPDAEIHVYHAWHVPYDGWQRDKALAEETARSANARMAVFLASAELPSGVANRVSTHMVHGDFGVATLSMLDEIGPDLVVLGTHGESGFIRCIIGSTALAALEFVDCDAMVVRDLA